MAVSPNFLEAPAPYLIPWVIFSKRPVASPYYYLHTHIHIHTRTKKNSLTLLFILWWWWIKSFQACQHHWHFVSFACAGEPVSWEIFKNISLPLWSIWMDTMMPQMLFFFFVAAIALLSFWAAIVNVKSTPAYLQLFIAGSNLALNSFTKLQLHKYYERYSAAFSGAH